MVTLRKTVVSHFNPRSPHGERRITLAAVRIDGMISIHAPRTGSDRAALNHPLILVRISIHAPRTGSDGHDCAGQGGTQISIHAPRTGSDVTFDGTTDTIIISIHAPRTGSDAAIRTSATSAVYFNPRSPHGERQSERCGSIAKKKISIHAPRTGSDMARLQRRAQTLNFNPRSPHGERLCKPFSAPNLGIFQSTLPARGATGEQYATTSYVDISIHAPRTGSDGASDSQRSISADFNPRSPHGERQAVSACKGLQVGDFNPRSPHGERL